MSENRGKCLLYKSKPRRCLQMSPFVQPAAENPQNIQFPNMCRKSSNQDILEAASKSLSFWLKKN